MGRPLGAYDSDELDRPDLNKCPDCGCFFATDDCPLCGKPCPPEMQAGHRAKVKPQKRRNSSGRVQFIAWYHQWWFMILISFFAPYIGIALFVTSPYSRRTKILVSAVAAAWFIVSYTGILPRLIGSVLYESPVNDDLSRAEYIELCEPLSVEDLHRRYETEDYVTMDLTVREKIDGEVTAYICTDRDGGELTVYLLDYQVADPVKFLPGDMIRVFGESGGMTWVEAGSAAGRQLPGVYIAYADLIG